jgi:hypothetical protein
MLTASPLIAVMRRKSRSLEPGFHWTTLFCVFCGIRSIPISRIQPRCWVDAQSRHLRYGEPGEQYVTERRSNILRIAGPQARSACQRHLARARAPAGSQLGPREEPGAWGTRGPAGPLGSALGQAAGWAQDGLPWPGLGGPGGAHAGLTPPGLRPGQAGPAPPQLGRAGPARCARPARPARAGRAAPGPGPRPAAGWARPRCPRPQASRSRECDG